MSRARISVLILAMNEEAFIERCIRSATFADEVLVVDSGSTDRTREIARSLGATVIEQPWLGWLGQKAAGAAAAANDWIFSLDADEIVTPRLALSVAAAMEADPDPANGYSLERKEEFLGRIMPNMRRPSKRRSFVRLFERTRSGWDPAIPVHEEIRCPGRILPLEGELLHWRNYTLARQLDTLNRNADIEADMIVREGGPSLLTLLAKPPLRFLWIYVARGFWRAGMRGFVAASLHAFAELLRHAKAWERRETTPVPHPPAEVYRPPAAQAVPRSGNIRTDVPA